ncbi:MAG: hypothetical protein ACR2PQ_07300 [Myxococcota bacterium]
MKRRVQNPGTPATSRHPESTTLLALLWSMPAESSVRELEAEARDRLSSGEVVLCGILRGECFWEEEEEAE